MPITVTGFLNSSMETTVATAPFAFPKTCIGRAQSDKLVY